MSIKFVIGPACSGKSTFIKNNFPGHTVVDLYDFQWGNMSLVDIMKSYDDTATALTKAVKESKDVVLEHTLLKRKRRQKYIDAVRLVTDEPIDIYCMLPSDEKFIQYYKERYKDVVVNADELDKDALNYYKEVMSVYEMPIATDGFRDIYVI